MATKERGQNPVVGDTLRLRLFMFNSNNAADLVSVDNIDISVLDPTAVSAENPTGKTIIATLDPSQIVHDDVGSYYIDVPLTDPSYVVGRYVDDWTVTYDSNMPQGIISNDFQVYPELWYASSKPIIYDFSFSFSPNKIRQGSIQYIRTKVTPNVPTATDLERYYENLAILGTITLSLEQKCGPCIPSESDLRLILDDVSMDYRENCFGYYQIDTTEMDCGVYNIWFKLAIGTNLFVSDKMNLLVYS